MFLSLPKVRSVSSYKYISRNKGQTLTLSSSLEEIIPLSDCKLLLNTLEKHNKKYNEVKLNNQIYTRDQLVSFIRIHELRDPQKRVETEIVWLEHEQYFVPQGCHRLDKSLLNIYKEKLLKGSDITYASRTESNMLTSDIALLSCKQWLNLSVIQVFADLLNKANKNTKIILFSAIQYLDFDSLKNLVNDWKQEGVESCWFIMNIHLSE